MFVISPSQDGFERDVLKSVEKLKNSLTFRYSKTPVLESLFNKVEEETPTKVFSCECYEIFKNSFLYRTPLVPGFVSLVK